MAAARERAEREGLSPEVAGAVRRAMSGAFVACELTEHRRRG